jgi:hypothetical protein
MLLLAQHISNTGNGRQKHQTTLRRDIFVAIEYVLLEVASSCQYGVKYIAKSSVNYQADLNYIIHT